jgi:L-alanine-DL-glutamate epimerase-like enolase superfamily enzyme
MPKLLLHDFELPLKHVFAISRGSIALQPTLIVELTDGAHHGYGEATTNGYYGATLASMRASLEAVRAAIEAIESHVEPVELWTRLAPQLEHDSFAQCALDQAAWDLWGKQQGAPLHKLWGLKTDDAPQSSFTIGIAPLDVMVAKLHEAPGWPSYKIKLGGEGDLDVIRELRRHTSAPFRVDANCGWTLDEAIDKSRGLADLNVDLLEQPLPADDWSGARRLFTASALPIIADESCRREADVERCCGAFHGINIKLVKCGGLTPARRMIARARTLGLRTMLGCMTESTVGISAVAQLLPLVDYADVDGAALLAQDIATGVHVDCGLCQFPTANGAGIRLNAQPGGLSAPGSAGG